MAPSGNRFRGRGRRKSKGSVPKKITRRARKRAERLDQSGDAGTRTSEALAPPR